MAGRPGSWLRENDSLAWKRLFGIHVKYRMNAPDRKEALTFEPPTTDSVFMGWDLQSGTTFRGDYFVCDLQQFFDVGLDGRVHIQSVREVWIPDDIIRFPLAEAQVAGILPALSLIDTIPKLDDEEPAGEESKEASGGEVGALPPPAKVRSYQGSARLRVAPGLTKEEWVSIG